MPFTLVTDSSCSVGDVVDLVQLQLMHRHAYFHAHYPSLRIAYISCSAGDFVDLVRRGFYAGMEIQRADGFVVQTGKPDGDVSGL